VAASPFDGAEELASARAEAAIEKGSPLSPGERRKVTREVLAEQKQLTPEQWLARFAQGLPDLSDKQLARLDETETFAKLPPKLQARVRGLLDQEDERRLAEEYNVEWEPPSDEEEAGPDWMSELDAEETSPAGDEELEGYSAETVRTSGSTSSIPEPEPTGTFRDRPWWGRSAASRPATSRGLPTGSFLPTAAEISGSARAGAGASTRSGPTAPGAASSQPTHSGWRSRPRGHPTANRSRSRLERCLSRNGT
jgi:hypothetical protein